MKNNKLNPIWIPNKRTANNMLLVQIECSINQKYEVLGNKSLYEYTLINKDISGVLKIEPQIKKSPIFRKYINKLPLGKEEFIYKNVYSRTGGVLNLFNPEVKENMDSNLNNLEKELEDKNIVIKKWRNIRSELWSGLTPSLVWAGGGNIEKLLLVDLCKKLTERFSNNKFYNEGSAILNSLEFLRTWQTTPNRICAGKRPMDAIIDERQRILIDKLILLNELGIKNDFME